MKICPITYESIPDDTRYSERGLKLLSPNLTELKNLPLSAEEQRQQAMLRSTKMSIQGVQAKLSAVLNVKESIFELTDRGGRYILKPQSHLYTQLPENEDVTMRLAETIDLEIPLHGLVYSIDNSLTYFIRRFDRVGRSDKLAVEDFAQLAGQTRDTKYDWTMERLVPLIETYCTFPIVEKLKLLKLTIFNYLVGNEDMHLKNFSIICHENKVEMSPCYDLINTTIAMPNVQEEIALPLRGKKRKLSYEDFRDYFAIERMQIPERVVDEVIQIFRARVSSWLPLIERSFLSETMRQRYRSVLIERARVFNIDIVHTDETQPLK